MQTLAAYRSVLASRPLARLLGGEFVSGIGDWLYIVAILVVIYRESADPAMLGLFGAARLLPYVVLSIPAGIAADRFDRRMILLVTDLARGATMLAIAALVAFDGPVAAIVVLAVLAACFSTFFYPAIGSYLPSLVEDERQLGPANSLWASLDNLGFIIGPAIGGLLIAAGGITVAFLVNAATFAVIAWVLWGLPPSRAGDRDRRPTDDARDTPELPKTPETETPSADSAPGAEASAPSADSTTGADPSAPSAESATGAAATAQAPDPTRAVNRSVRPLAGILVLEVVAGLFVGAVAVLSVVLAVDILEAGEAATGYLNAAVGVGGLVGAVGSGILVLRRSLGLPLLLAAVILAVGFAFLGASGTLVLAMIAMAVISAGTIGLDVIQTTILQRATPDAILGRAVGIRMSLSTVAQAAGSFALPVAVVGLGALPVLGAGAVAIVAASLVAVVLIGPALTRAPSPFEATLARVTQLPLFAGVDAARLEAALRRLVTVPVSAGDVVIREGDPADRFYIVESGEFVVTQAAPDGTVRELRRLGPDTVFGELGLLNAAPRSATVTAATEGVLLALDGDAFLELVGAGSRAGLRGRLLGLYSGTGTSATR